MSSTALKRKATGEDQAHAIQLDSDDEKDFEMHDDLSAVQQVLLENKVKRQKHEGDGQSIEEQQSVQLEDCTTSSATAGDIEDNNVVENNNNNKDKGDNIDESKSQRRNSHHRHNDCVEHIDHLNYHDHVYNWNREFHEKKEKAIEKGNDVDDDLWDGFDYFPFHHPNGIALDVFLTAIDRGEIDKDDEDTRLAFQSLLKYRSKLIKQQAKFDQIVDQREEFEQSMVDRVEWIQENVQIVPTLDDNDNIENDLHIDHDKAANGFCDVSLDINELETYCAPCDRFTSRPQAHGIVNTDNSSRITRHLHHRLCFCDKCLNNFTRIQNFVDELVPRLTTAITTFADGTDFKVDLKRDYDHAGCTTDDHLLPTVRERKQDVCDGKDGDDDDCCSAADDDLACDEVHHVNIDGTIDE